MRSLDCMVEVPPRTNASLSVGRRRRHDRPRTWELVEPPFQFRATTIEITNDGREQPVVSGSRSLGALRASRGREGRLLWRAPHPRLSHGICQVGEDTIREDREGLLSEERSQSTAASYSYGPNVEYVAVEQRVFCDHRRARRRDLAERCELLSTDRGGTPKEPDGSLFESELIYAPAEVGRQGETRRRSWTAVYAGPKDFDALKKFGHRRPM